jgi:hypothetical protein
MLSAKRSFYLKVAEYCNGGTNEVLFTNCVSTFELITIVIFCNLFLYRSGTAIYDSCRANRPGVLWNLSRATYCLRYTIGRCLGTKNTLVGLLGFTWSPIETALEHTACGQQSLSRLRVWLPHGEQSCWSPEHSISHRKALADAKKATVVTSVPKSIESIASDFRRPCVRKNTKNKESDSPVHEWATVPQTKAAQSHLQDRKVEPKLVCYNQAQTCAQLISPGASPTTRSSGRLHQHTWF